ncbi:hypothetical protein B0T17DRAFT_309396 [Bombardia bombarda]|uniref:RING-type domain-containing protein n=1 Tax=Bombardia bombarda TaxID=252184 RepID=A0AA40C1Z0_9PEZI|nr:hypothetical protein B0T17DRAFT_309396 [Bombardia bombarda]
MSNQQPRPNQRRQGTFRRLAGISQRLRIKFEIRSVISFKPASQNSGLDNAEQQRPNGDEPQVLNYLPAVVAWLRAQHGPKPVVECPICNNQVELPGLQEDDGERETHTLLPCDHILGLDCFCEWVKLKRSDPNAAGVVCPICRAVMFTQQAWLADQDEFLYLRRVSLQAIPLRNTLQVITY